MVTICILVGSMAGFLGGAVALIAFGATVLSAFTIWAATGLVAMIFGMTMACATNRARDSDDADISEEVA